MNGMATGRREATDAGAELREMLLFRVGGEHFAVELGASEEVLEWPGVERLARMPVSPLRTWLQNPGRVSRSARSFRGL